MDNSEYDRMTTAKFVRRLLESPGKEGVYYVVKFPSRWRLYSFPSEDFGDLWHGDVWRRFVVKDLAEAWANVSAEQLKDWWKGFPRGRVERGVVLEYTIFHGNDLAETEIALEGIEKAFELTNCKITWSTDPREQQDPEHRAALEQLLKSPRPKR